MGFVSGSLAVIGDGVDSATDVVISMVMIYTARVMNRPPSKQFVYGYEKAEGIATKILAMVIFYAGVQMMITSVKNIFVAEEKTLPGMIAIYVTVASIIGKLLLSWYQFRQGKKIKSLLLIANAKNMRNDVLISCGVLVGLLFTFLLKLPVLDAVTGLFISLFIIRSSVSIFMESNVDLMDGVKDTSIYKKIFDAVEKVPDACNPHRVRSRQIGNLYMISLDIEADGDITLNEAHQIAEQVENSLKTSIENIYDIVVHVEPKGKIHAEEKFGIDRRMI